MFSSDIGECEFKWAFCTGKFMLLRESSVQENLYKKVQILPREVWTPIQVFAV